MKASRKLFLAAAAAVAALGYALPSAAHHSFATEFDSRKPLLLEGTVTRFQMVNPHSWLYLDVRNPDGTTTNWGFEFGTPLSLREHGITRQSVAQGTRLRLSGFRAKNGGAFGYAAIVRFPDGHQVAIGSAPDAPALAIR